MIFYSIKGKQGPWEKKEETSNGICTMCKLGSKCVRTCKKEDLIKINFELLSG